jgi:hypothetical protein
MAVSFNMMVRFGFTAFFLLSLVVPFGGVRAENQALTKTVVVMGTGEIRGDDSANAREEAISNSLVSAVDRVTIDILPIESLIANFQEINEVLYGQAGNFIQGYKVLTEFPTDVEYKVIVEATVSVRSLKELISSIGIILDKKVLPKILVLVSEQKLDDVLPKYWWGEDAVFSGNISESVLAETMKAKGYAIINHRALVRDVGIETEYDKPDLNDIEAVALGLRLQADVVITGRAVAKRAPNIMGADIKSFKGTVAVRAIRTDTGERIADTIKTSVTANTDKVAGGMDALSGAASLAGQELVPKITLAWQQDVEKPTRVEIMVEGTGNLSNFVKFRSILNQIIGVKDLQIKEMKSNEATIVVDFQGNAKALADALMLKTFGSIGINIYEVSKDQLRIELISG